MPEPVNHRAAVDAYARRPSQRLARRLRRRGWGDAGPLRRRLLAVVYERRSWHDWQRPLMALVGRDDSGTWGVPRVRDLYLRDEWSYDRTAPSKAEAFANGVHHVEQTRHAMTAWDGVKRGESWRCFDSQDDGATVRVGYLGDDGRLHDTGIDGRRELALFRRWLLWDAWVVAEWLGLRTWLYWRALHASVADRVPFTCRAAARPGSGAYGHWNCLVPVGVVGTVRRWVGAPVVHEGPHRYRNYTWSQGDDRVEYAPVP